ncbi:MGMT family protein [Compostimonas suwonensis]|uniref:Alkylated DNA nucleotide flippase Atl1 n=1 Tax=Compostimonas suwonensis TaxID=1048394 RepID=A0A2M9BVB5_9MICO|nr:MGMT family protein [Compostimonas suwonensis]PJJ61890.1 alkylated DNA nucleotide flippase Atl1 [Compostimonas suwonensis]
MPSHSDDFVGRVLEVVDSIPEGQVLSYGDVAAFLGSRGARVVGQVMARYGSEVPWWRVIRSSGQPPVGHEASARPHYEREGTPLVVGADGAYRVNIRAARWRP